MLFCERRSRRVTRRRHEIFVPEFFPATVREEWETAPVIVVIFRGVELVDFRLENHPCGRIANQLIVPAESRNPRIIVENLNPFSGGLLDHFQAHVVCGCSQTDKDRNVWKLPEVILASKRFLVIVVQANDEFDLMEVAGLTMEGFDGFYEAIWAGATRYET